MPRCMPNMHCIFLKVVGQFSMANLIDYSTSSCHEALKGYQSSRHDQYLLYAISGEHNAFCAVL